ncbi:hypothetical protein ACOME3_010680 [Neoechinorhynchus agilis]
MVVLMGEMDKKDKKIDELQKENWSLKAELRKLGGNEASSESSSDIEEIVITSGNSGKVAQPEKQITKKSRGGNIISNRNGITGDLMFSRKELNLVANVTGQFFDNKKMGHDMLIYSLGSYGLRTKVDFYSPAAIKPFNETLSSLINDKGMVSMGAFNSMVSIAAKNHKLLLGQLGVIVLLDQMQRTTAWHEFAKPKEILWVLSTGWGNFIKIYIGRV